MSPNNLVKILGVNGRRSHPAQGVCAAIHAAHTRS